MKLLVGSVLAWSVVVLLFLFFDPGFPRAVLPCMALVGRSVACETGQAELNSASWWLHTLPLMAALAGGYLAIALIYVMGRRRRSRRTGERGVSRG